MTTTEVRDKLRQAGYLGAISIEMRVEIMPDTSTSEVWTLELNAISDRSRMFVLRCDGPALGVCLLQALEKLKTPEVLHKLKEYAAYIDAVRNK